MSNIKFYIGPMSKNVVDAVIEFTEETGNKIGFIPSRRQVEYNGGYVNNWTTEEFSKYVNGRVPIERDHGGVGQGYVEDDGYKSFRHDAKNLDIIHIDPWKVYPKYEDGLQSTIESIKKIYNINPEVLFEVGTEEAIRYFTPDDLERLLKDLSEFDFFDNIKYAVVQSGVGLDLGKRVNTGNFDLDRLKDFIRVCKRWGKLSKEHNGDYLEDYYKICYDSRRWEKWVGEDFVPEDNKEELIKICGHYVLSDKRFKKIKPDINDKIKSIIKNKLRELCQEI